MGQIGGPRFQFINLARQLLAWSSMETPTQPMPEGQPPFSTGSPMARGNKLSLAALFQNESSALNPQELSQFLKESLKLPQEIRTLLLMLALEKTPSETLQAALKKTLAETLTQQPEIAKDIPLDEVTALLSQNSREAHQKLMRLLQGTAMSQTQGGRQVADLVGTLGQLNEQIAASPAKALETLMLLYLPWYPLTLPQKLDLTLEGGHSEGGATDGEAVSITLYLQTNTLGQFKITVKELQPLQIQVQIAHEQKAALALPELETRLNDLLASDGLPAALFESEPVEPHAFAKPDTTTAPATQPESKPSAPMAASGSQGFQFATRRADRQKLHIAAGQRVSFLVIHTGYSLARLIFEVDEANRVFQR